MAEFASNRQKNASYREKNASYRNRFRFRSKISIWIDILTWYSVFCCISQENIRLISNENIAWDSRFRFKLHENLLQIGNIHFRWRISLDGVFLSRHERITTSTHHKNYTSLQTLKMINSFRSGDTFSQLLHSSTDAFWCNSH